MAVLSIIAPEIPAESKDRFVEAWPVLLNELKSQPSVAGASGGIIVAQDGAAVTDFKFVQSIAFKSEKDADDFAASAWAAEHQARYREKAGGDPAMGRFEVPEFPADASPTPFLQLSTLILDDKSKHAEARQAWMDLVKLLGKETFGGRSLGDGPFVGIGMIGWDSLEQAGEAFKKPEVAASWTAYKSLGTSKNIMIRHL